MIVEDQARLGQFLQNGLTDCSYTVSWVRTCKAALDALAESTFDVILLDLGLPDGDGLDLLHQWRKNGFNEPVLILSARDTVESRIKGLDHGADDYLPKPFSFEELLARVRSLVRRQSAVKLAVLEHRGIQLNLTNHTVQIKGEEIDLTSREFASAVNFLHLIVARANGHSPQVMTGLSRTTRPQRQTAKSPHRSCLQPVKPPNTGNGPTL